MAGVAAVLLAVGGPAMADATTRTAPEEDACNPATSIAGGGHGKVAAPDSTAAPASATAPVDTASSALVPKPRAKEERIVNLLQQVDVKRDAVKGNWTMTKDGLMSDGTIPFCRLRLPYQPTGEYDFRVKFTRHQGSDVLQMLAYADTGFTFLMGGWGNRTNGLDRVAGHPFSRDGIGVVGSPCSLRNGQRYTSLVQVRKDSVSTFIDGVLVARHPTDYSDLSVPPEWSLDGKTLGLGTTFCLVTFHAIEVLQAPATDLRAAAAVPAKADKSQPATSRRGDRSGSVNASDMSRDGQKWPPMTGKLLGAMEVRVRNPNDFQVKVGLRSGGKGRDFTVAANGTRSVGVPNGRYDIYFQYSYDPHGLYQGDAFTLNNNGVEIQIVKVVNGNYGIRKVN